MSAVPSAAELREWARELNLAVGDRGQPPKAVYERWNQEHAEEPPLARALTGKEAPSYAPPPVSVTGRRIDELALCLDGARVVGLEEYRAHPPAMRGALVLGADLIRFVVEDHRILDIPGGRAVVDAWRERSA